MGLTALLLRLGNRALSGEKNLERARFGTPSAGGTIRLAVGVVILGVDRSLVAVVGEPVDVGSGDVMNAPLVLSFGYRAVAVEPDQIRMALAGALPDNQILETGKGSHPEAERQQPP